MTKSYQKILVVNVNWVGDVIFSLPVFKALKAAFPGAHVACLAAPRVKEILESSSFVDEIIVYDEKGKHDTLFAKLNLIFELKKKNFEVAFLLHRTLTRALFMFLAGIPERVGYDEKGRGFFLTHIVKPFSGGHRSDYYLNVIESFGIKVEDRTCDIRVDKAAEEKIKTLLSKYEISDQDFLVVLHPGGNWDLKRWPKENFSLLANRLIKEKNAKVVIVGGPDDTALAQEILGLTESKPVILTGQTNLKELMALMKRAELVVSADSGPLHIASGVGTKTIGLFGPTRPEVTGPRGKGKSIILQHDVVCNRAPCYNLTCPNNMCMQSITVDDVLNFIP